MTWTDALDAVVARTRVERYRWLCSEDNPDAESRAAYRSRMVELVTGEPDPTSGVTPAEDLALQAHIAAHPCGSC